MPEDMPQTELEEFLSGVHAAYDDPCILNTSASYWHQRGYATGVVDRIDRQFGYTRGVHTSAKHVQ